METAIITGFVAFTSIVVYLIGKRALGLQPLDLSSAVVVLVETLGVSVFFLMINVALALFALLTLRLSSSYFVSLYIVADSRWFLFSIIQGFSLSVFAQEVSRIGLPKPNAPQKPLELTFDGSARDSIE